MPPTLIELEKEEARLKSSISSLAENQVNLSRSIAKIKPFLEELENKKLELQTEINEIIFQKEKRLAERDTDFERRDGALRRKTHEVDKLLAREKDLDELTESILRKSELSRIREHDFDTRQEAILKDEKNLKASLDEFNETYIKDMNILGDREKIISQEESGIAYKIDELNGLIKDNEDTRLKHESSLAELLKLKNQCEVVLSKARQELKFAKDKNEQADTLLQKLNKSLSECEERRNKIDSINKGQEQDKKRIELAWLKINKIIRDKNLDMELDKLRNG